MNTQLRRPSRNFRHHFGQPNPLKKILESWHSFNINFNHANELLMCYRPLVNNQVIFPDCVILQNIKHQSIIELSYTNAIIIIVACIYYLDKSEIPGWIKSFNGNLSGLRMLFRFSDMDKSHLYEKCEAYIIYDTIYSLLSRYKNAISEIIQNDKFLMEYI